MSAGKLLVGVGVGLVVVGLLTMLASKAGVKLFRLPGDMVWRGKSTTIYFPIVTSIVLSVLLTALLALINRR